MGLEAKHPYKTIFEKDTTQKPGRWNFAEFPFNSPEDPRLLKALDEIPEQVAAFISRFKLAFQNKTDPKLVKTYLEEIDLIICKIEIPTSYLKLHAQINTDLEPKNSKAQELFSTAYEKIFSQLRQLLRNIPDEEFGLLTSSPQLKEYGSSLIKLREESKHHDLENDIEREALSVKEESLKSQYFQLRNSVRVLSNANDPISVVKTYSLLPQIPEQSDKELVWKRLMDAYAKNSHVAADLIVKLAETRIREASLIESGPLTERLKDEKVDEKTIDALSSAAMKAIPVVKEMEQVIAEFYGFEKFKPWNYFPETSVVTRVSYNDALRSISSAWSKVAPQLGKLIEEMERDGWIDISSGPKTSSSQMNFSSPFHSFPRVYYDSSFKGFRTLAHELGHSLYRGLLKNKKLFTGKTPYYHLNEAIALFSEEIAVREFKELFRPPDDENPKSFFGERYNLIHHNLRLHSFEKLLFQKISSGEKLQNVDLGYLYNKGRKEWGFSTSEESAFEWVGVQHFFTHPNYVWMYSIGKALANSLEQLSDEIAQSGKPTDFGNKLVNMLAEGSSRTSQELFKDYFDLDLNSPGFWGKAFAPLEQRLKKFKNR